MTIEKAVEEVKEAVRLLFYWQYNDTNSFHDQLYCLFQKADVTNLEKLKRGFPAEYSAWNGWRNHGNQDEFFKNWGYDWREFKRKEKERINGSG